MICLSFVIICKYWSKKWESTTYIKSVRFNFYTDFHSKCCCCIHAVVFDVVVVVFVVLYVVDVVVVGVFLMLLWILLLPMQNVKTLFVMKVLITTTDSFVSVVSYSFKFYWKIIKGLRKRIYRKKYHCHWIIIYHSVFL